MKNLIAGSYCDNDSFLTNIFIYDIVNRNYCKLSFDYIIALYRQNKNVNIRKVISTLPLEPEELDEVHLKQIQWFDVDFFFDYYEKNGEFYDDFNIRFHSGTFEEKDRIKQRLLELDLPFKIHFVDQISFTIINNNES